MRFAKALDGDREARRLYDIMLMIASSATFYRTSHNYIVDV